jgi:hypothetical protein
VRRDRQHWDPGAVGVEQAVDEVQVSRAAQLAAHTASCPVIAASPAAANAAAYS